MGERPPFLNAFNHFVDYRPGFPRFLSILRTTFEVLELELRGCSEAILAATIVFQSEYGRSPLVSAVGILY